MYKELIEHSVKNRGKIVHVTEISGKPVNHERYTSLFTFDESIKDYVELNGSVTGFEGACTADGVWIDVDCSDLSQAQKTTQEIIKHINRQYGVKPKEFTVYFSGNKGFHIFLHQKLIGGIPVSEDTPARMKAFVKAICNAFKEVDIVIYNTTRIFRTPNSLNAKSSLFKVPISIAELAGDISVIKTIAKQPRPNYEHPKYHAFKENVKLKRLWNRDLDSEDYKNSDGYVKQGERLFTGTAYGGRNNKAYYQACQLLEKSNLALSDIEDIIRATNLQNVPPLSDEEITAIVSSASKSKSAGKRPELIKETLQAVPLYSLTEDYVNSLKDDEQQISLCFEGFDKSTRGNLRGKVCAFVGYAGSKKSLYAMNIISANTEGRESIGIYSTMEMPARELYKRMLDYSYEHESGNFSEYVEKVYREGADVKEDLEVMFKEKFGDKYLVTENSRMDYDKYDQLLSEQNERGKRVDILVVDGLSMMGGKGNTEFERVSHNSAALKELAKKYNVFIMVMVHVSKGATKHTRDLVDKMRDSNKIEDNFDMFITMSRVIDPVESTQENIHYTNRYGFMKLWNKRGDGSEIDQVYEFKSNTLTLIESSVLPYEAEVDISKLPKAGDNNNSNPLLAKLNEKAPF